MFKELLHAKHGAVALEHALIAGFLVLAIVMAVSQLGRVMGDTFDNVAEEVTAAGR
ncbi:Flp family type IVb pilin [Chelativorans sp. Marseille-P2723]|uniref:Flp family type IVb pilin n=1 Tax=Chelativorans sp. Marseille-P2723 TaxID=2709133 RepID=UPI00156F97AC|nr:Flp family type IVb pilin [Chelativorans sp. Marseille-P2723]